MHKLFHHVIQKSAFVVFNVKLHAFTELKLQYEKLHDKNRIKQLTM
jgi:hypothetical protein